MECSFIKQCSDTIRKSLEEINNRPTAVVVIAICGREVAMAEAGISLEEIRRVLRHMIDVPSNEETLSS